MANRTQSVAKRLVSGIEDIVEGSYKKIEDLVRGEFQDYQRQIDVYKKKAQVVDIAVRYLKNGTEAVSAADRKKVGAAYAKKLEEVASFNRKYQKARESAKEVPGLKRKVTALETAKSRLQTKYDEQKKRYDLRIANLQKKYDEAEFVRDQIARLRNMTMKGYESNMRDEETLKKFEESTYYHGKPSLATYALQDTIALIRGRNRVQGIAKRYENRIQAILEGKDPDEDDKGSETSNSGTSKPAKKVKIPRKKKK